jgi:hypothetical protein
VSRKGALYAHHCRFVDGAEALPLWQTVAQG